MAEKIFAVVPGFSLTMVVALRTHIAILTDVRLLLLPEGREGYEAVQGLVGTEKIRTAEGPANEDLFSRRELDPLTLAEDPLVWRIPLDSILSLRVKRRGYLARFLLRHGAPGSKAEDLRGHLFVPKEYLYARKRQGVGGLTALREYLKEVREVFHRGFPSLIVSRTAWDI